MVEKEAFRMMTSLCVGKYSALLSLARAAGVLTSSDLMRSWTEL